MKKTLWKDILASFKKSKGRFISILCLMMLGSFALVGLYVTGPNMRETGRAYFDELNLADVTIVGDYGIDSDDQELIDTIENVDQIEYGYFSDVVLKNDTETSFRIFSKPENLSQYEVVDGRLPEDSEEIAISNEYSADVKIGDSIEFIEFENALTEQTFLKQTSYTVVGYVHSSEILSAVNLGQSMAGTGSLDGYGVVISDVFDSNFYMIARLSFNDTAGQDPYSEEYINLVQNHKDSIEVLLENQPERRLASIKKEAQTEIDDGYAEIADAREQIEEARQELEDAIQQIEDAKQEVVEGQQRLDEEVADAQSQIEDGQQQINEATESINETENQLAQARNQLAEGQETLDQKWHQLRNARVQLNQAKQSLDTGKRELDDAKQSIRQGRSQLAAGYQEVEENREKLQVAQSEIETGRQELTQAREQYNEGVREYEAGIQELQQAKQQFVHAQAEIDEKQAEIDSNQEELEVANNEYLQIISSLKEDINELNEQLEDPDLTEEERRQIHLEIAETTAQLDKISTEYDVFINQVYNPGMEQMEYAQAELDQAQEELDTQKQAAQPEIEQKVAELAAAKNQLEEANKEIEGKTEELNEAETAVEEGFNQIAQANQELSENQDLLDQKEAEYQSALSQYNEGLSEYNDQLSQYYAGLEEWESGAAALSEGSAEYRENAERLDQARAELASRENELDEARSELIRQKMEGEREIADAEQEIADAEQELEEKQAEFEKEEADAEQEIAENEETLEEAQERLDSLSPPAYSVSTRSETLGSEGYRIYDSTSFIIDSLANIFPMFLYFVAALVTSTTMTRFVDEERTNSGTLIALGYSKTDVLKKFAVYGLVSSVVGSILGIILGHTVLPMIVNNAYESGFTLPTLELHFYPGISLIALILGTSSATIPAYLVAAKELQEKPASLLSPKPPVAGSKIFLEKVTPLWNRMRFTHKVTARNLFRYKKRMAMTIFGVAGAVTLLVAGFGVQHSISGINERQFDNLITYNMIVARNDYVSTEEEKEIDNLLSSEEVEQQLSIYYEELFKVVGDNQVRQSITLIVPENSDYFDEYITLVDRADQKELVLEEDGVIISERFAELLNVEIGDTISVRDGINQNFEMKVSGITEMYMGHFMFMNQEAYEDIFSNEFVSNADLVILKNPNEETVKKLASEFMELTGVLSVVQNTTLSTQIEIIVDSLNEIMIVLIVVAILLAIVILYNLININVSERIRELSTIKVLGFYDQEVTLYIYRETVLLSLFGILVGYGLGILLHSYIISAVPPDDVMFNPELWINSFVIPLIIILVVIIILGFNVNRRMKRVDMLEALKSVE